MEKNVNLIYLKNLDKQNFSTTINVAVDSNVNIKTVLNINSYMFDEKIECVNGKAVISGKIGLKILYIDTDNITNTISDNQPFSQIIQDSSITNQCHINLSNVGIINNVVTSSNILKINCELNFIPVMYLNLGFNTELTSSENLISKKSTINTSCMDKIINSKFEYLSTFETKDKVSKVLDISTHFCPTSSECNENCITVEGKLYTTLFYETTSGDETCIKEISDCFVVKSDVEILEINSSNKLDVSFCINKNLENVSIELEEDNSVISINNTIKICGVALKDISVDVVEDLYSTDNEIETSLTNRKYVSNCIKSTIEENVSNEISLNKDEPAIDEVVSNLNMCAEITNSYIKDNNLIFEGVITSALVYIDENKEYQQKRLEIPFVINSKIEQSELCSNHTDISILNCKTKVKRGSVIEIEYSVVLTCCVYEINEKEIVGNVVIGKPLDFSMYDYQIFIAKPGESLWSLSKRIKVCLEELEKYNKDLPQIFEGGEKIIIKR